MTEHTPGRWFAKKGKFVVSSSGIVAVMVAGETREEMGANAQLVAAAPELLSELKRVRQGLLNLIEMNLIRRQIVKRIQKVIDKAQGGSNLRTCSER